MIEKTIDDYVPAMVRFIDEWGMVNIREAYLRLEHETRTLDTLKQKRKGDTKLYRFLAEVKCTFGYENVNILISKGLREWKELYSI